MYHNYFGTPVGTEYKKRFARNVGIAVLVLFVFYEVWSLVVEVSEPEHTRIPQNDLLCATEWWVTYAEFDKDSLVSSLHDTISGFGTDVDMPDREITISERTRIVISIQGDWTGNTEQHRQLTSEVRSNIGDAKLMRDDVVMCA